ncbi:hypothetical protein [Terricaulis sp.]|uniref:hypothetical protein n=1 Tax=Terricaulis sp. TaxID=2768686 RepID=UPI0037839729
MFTRIIKIAGKSRFDQLTPEEFGVMIDAFLDGGNEAFDGTALSEFIGTPSREPRLRALQIEIVDNMLLPSEAEGIPPVNEPWLRALSRLLKAGG